MPWQNGDLTISTVTQINKPKLQLIFVQLITLSNIFQYSFTIQFKFWCEFLIYAFCLVWICKVFCLYFASRDFITSKQDSTCKFWLGVMLYPFFALSRSVYEHIKRNLTTLNWMNVPGEICRQGNFAGTWLILWTQVTLKWDWSIFR